MALAVMRLAKDRGHESFDENTVRELKAVVAAGSVRKSASSSTSLERAALGRRP